ncbi:hypothetical protein LTR10_002394 [Elasticomyces elasticus]|nr:hypothetical protein LTR10_002394 [Elasticomyces elasticus]KAK4973538.1 hypothetical protein LTR42_005527 [Elasticomyces elasticus]
MEFKDYFNNSTHADVTLRIGDLELPAHKLILIKGRSHRLCHFYREDDPEALKALVSTFYGHTAYDKQTIDSTSEGVELLKCLIDLYVIASKYLVPNLCSQILDDFPEMLEAASGGQGYSGNVLKVAWHVYRTHAEAAVDLRDPITSVIATSIGKWQGDDRFPYLIRSQSDLAVDVIRMLAGTLEQRSAKKPTKAADVTHAAEAITVSRKRTRQR